MDNIDDKGQNGILDELFADSDWETGPDGSLDVGCDYVYRIGEDAFSSVAVKGRVLFNDGVTAVLKVIERYAECYFIVLSYDKVIQFIPGFHDTDPQRNQNEYLCLDVATEENLFCKDPDTGVIGVDVYDENGECEFTPLDPFEFKMNRLKLLLLYRLEEIEREGEKKQDGNVSTISVDLSSDAIDEMYKEYDQQHRNPTSNNELPHSLNRSIHWLTQRDCAIVTAWRGGYNRSENNDRNRKLLQELKALGYGVIQVKGCYAEMGKPLEQENSFIAFELGDSDYFMQNIYGLSEFYEQDSFLYKPKNEDISYLVGTNDAFGKDRIEIAGLMRINSKTATAFTKVGSGIISFEKKE